MQDTSGDVITRAAVGLALGTIAAFSLFIWSSAAWSDTATSVALQALIGFLTIAATSWMYTYYRTTGLVSHAILLSLLISLSVIHIGGAIPLLYVTIPTIIKTAPDKVSDILEVTIIAIAFVLASTRRHQESKRRLSPWIVALLAVIILAFYGGLYFFIFLNLSEPMLVLLAYAIGIVTILLLAYSIAFFSRMPFSFGTTDAALFLVSNGLFILSIIPLLLSMISSTLVWALSLTLQGLGMLLIILVLSISSQREMGMTERAALSFPIVNSLLAIVPFLVAILAQVALPAVLIVDVPAYRLSHIGAAALSGVMTFLIYAHFKRKPRRVHFPLVLVFACWTLIEIFIVASLDPETLIATGESLVPYIIGSLASSIGLLRAVEWAKEPKEGHAPHGIEKWVIWRFAVVAAVVILGAHLEGFLVLEFAMLEGSPLGRAILLCTNLAAMFIVIHLTYMLAKEQGSWSTL
ncbi:MAG: hypothetical protein EAX95_14630, partial [Candidatus Thorarchaeota archaeon]|nr:hypothetical protein [Candidatus Thorarchaeota archaeon]